MHHEQKRGNDNGNMAQNTEIHRIHGIVYRVCISDIRKGKVNERGRYCEHWM